MANHGDLEVLFVLPTAALVPIEIYQSAYEIYLDGRPEILMSCERFHSSPYWALTRTDAGWRALFPKMVLINSQDLPDTLADAGLFYFFDLEVMANYRSVKLVERTEPIVVADKYACDVDTLDDWERLESKYASLLRERGRQ